MAVMKDKKTPNKKKETVKKEPKFEGLRNFFGNIKLIWANRQYRSAIKLFLYIIFMIAVLLFIQAGYNQNDNNIIIKTPLESFGDLDNYSYQTVINENNNLTIIDGNHLNGENNFAINGINYFTKDKQVYMVNNNESVLADLPFIINIFDLTPSTIENMISKSEKVSKTNYKNGMVETNYQLSAKEFAKIYANKDIVSNDFVTITTRLEDNKINRIILNVTNYFKIENPMINTYLIEINYNKQKEQ